MIVVDCYIIHRNVFLMVSGMVVLEYLLHLRKSTRHLDEWPAIYCAHLNSLNIHVQADGRDITNICYTGSVVPTQITGFRRLDLPLIPFLSILNQPSSMGCYIDNAGNAVSMFYCGNAIPRISTNTSFQCWMSSHERL